MTSPFWVVRLSAVERMSLTFYQQASVFLTVNAPSFSFTPWVKADLMPKSEPTSIRE
jgi:hypothetical protein